MLSILLNDFMGQALLAGFGLALISGPLGCFLVWRRMAFFGDALAHSALLGVALGIMLNLNMTIGILIVCLLCALILAMTHTQKNLSTDAWLGILSYGALALGILALSKSGANIDTDSYLFGDILTLTTSDLYWIYGCVVFVGGFFFFHWRQLLLLTLDEELAQTAGVSAPIVQGAFMLTLALTVAISLKAVGALLIPALLIMPAATAGRFARSPEHMAILAIGIAMVAISGGLVLSVVFNTPSGATIVATCLSLFVVSCLKR